MIKLNEMNEDRLYVPSMVVVEDDDVDIHDTGRVDKDGEPILIAISNKQGFMGFVPPGMAERIKREREEAEAKKELTELIEEVVAATLMKLGLLHHPDDVKKPKARVKARKED